jgi:hypothetical protein
LLNSFKKVPVLVDGRLFADKLSSSLIARKKEAVGHLVEFPQAPATMPRCQRERKPGDPLLVYPEGKSPLDRGLLVYH